MKYIFILTGLVFVFWLGAASHHGDIVRNCEIKGAYDENYLVIRLSAKK